MHGRHRKVGVNDCFEQCIFTNSMYAIILSSKYFIDAKI